MIVAVAPDLPGSSAGDEGFAVGLDADEPLGGWSVSDGHGIFAFPVGTAVVAGHALWTVGNETAWQAFSGPAAPLSWRDSLHLGNAAGNLRLSDPAGRVVDEVAWGPGTGLNFTSPGLVYERDNVDGLWQDTDRPIDWVTPRIHRIGESMLDQPTFHVHDLTIYASPDSSFGVLSQLISSATRRLQLHVYELRSADLVDHLVAAKNAHPSLDLAVLVEASPVGMTASDRHATSDALRRIEAVGGKAVLAGHGRYDDHHLKVLVADDTVAVQSENWVESGVPAEPTWGNRGWGAAVHDATMADWFATWMAEDRQAWDAAPFDLADYDPLFAQPPRTAARTGPYGPIIPAAALHGDFDVTPIISPDDTADPRRDPLAQLVAAATVSIETEQLDLAVGAGNRLGWSSADPFASALSAAAARGIPVRVLAAAPFGDSAGNSVELDAISAAGAAARVLDRPGIALLHNKGLIVDDAVVVGSINANHHSRSANREVDLLLRGPGVADYYRRLFDADWNEESRGPDAGVIGRDLHGLPGAPWPMLLAAVGLAVKGWTSRFGHGPPSP